MGSLHSKLIEHNIARVTDLDLVSCDIYTWCSGQPGKDEDDWALVYSALDTKPGICSTHFRLGLNKMILTFYDAFCLENFVAVNIEFVSVKDEEEEHYKLGPIDVKKFGEKLTANRLRLAGSERLFLSYVMGRRRNQFVLLRQGEDYQIVFDSKSPLVLLHHSVRISCDSLDGELTMSNTRPMIDGPAAEKVPPLFDVKYHKYNEPPPQDVVKDVYTIRRQLLEKTIARGNTYNVFKNSGIINGDGDGCINNKWSQQSRQ